MVNNIFPLLIINSKKLKLLIIIWIIIFSRFVLSVIVLTKFYKIILINMWTQTKIKS